MRFNIAVLVPFLLASGVASVVTPSSNCPTLDQIQAKYTEFCTEATTCYSIARSLCENYDMFFKFVESLEQVRITPVIPNFMRGADLVSSFNSKVHFGTATVGHLEFRIWWDQSRFYCTCNYCLVVCKNPPVSKLSADLVQGLRSMN